MKPKRATTNGSSTPKSTEDKGRLKSVNTRSSDSRFKKTDVIQPETAKSKMVEDKANKSSGLCSTSALEESDDDDFVEVKVSKTKQKPKVILKKNTLAKGSTTNNKSQDSKLISGSKDVGNNKSGTRVSLRLKDAARISTISSDSGTSKNDSLESSDDEESDWLKAEEKSKPSFKAIDRVTKRARSYTKLNSPKVSSSPVKRKSILAVTSKSEDASLAKKNTATKSKIEKNLSDSGDEDSDEMETDSKINESSTKGARISKEKSNTPSPVKQMAVNKSLSKSPTKSKKKKNSKTESTEVAGQSTSILYTKSDIDSMDVLSLLAIGEKMGIRPSNTNRKSDVSTEISTDEEDDWEEVDEGEQSEQNQERQAVIPAEGVVITLPGQGGNFVRRRGKKKFDLNDYIRKELNRKTKEVQIDLHKASLVCLIARGLIFNGILKYEELLATALSVLPIQLTIPPKHMSLTFLTKLLTWYRINYRISIEEEDDNEENSMDLVETLKLQLVSKITTSHDNLVFIFIVLLRSLGIDIRLIYSLQPLPLKPLSDGLLKKPKNTDEVSTNEDEEESEKPSKDSKSKKNAKSKKVKKDVKKSSTKSKNENLGPKIISSDEESEYEEEVGKSKKKKFIKNKVSITLQKGKDFWIEVYLEEEERWVSVELSSAKILSDNELEKKATQPVYYVLGYDNSGKVKDLTRKYASRWLTHTIKQRVDSDWWERTLKPYMGRRTAKDREEDDFLDVQLMTQPYPKTVAEFKGHPLFALRRHLLRYEAIYPPEPPTLGFIKNEPIYSRDCVVTIRSRELWTREARVVRAGETCYKVVKSRPKWDRMTNQMIKEDRQLELFGEWQTDEFVPPTAKDGKVPRNEYGNVELFLEKMIPKGCVHLQTPGLGRVAKKLDIDCAQALTGFEFRRGGSVPVFEGFVVCEEFKEVLLDAWNQDQEEQRKKDEEKRLNRIHGNWKKLYRAVMIHQRMKRKYPDAFTESSKRKFEEASGSSTEKKRQKKNPNK